MFYNINQQDHTHGTCAHAHPESLVRYLLLIWLDSSRQKICNMYSPTRKMKRNKFVVFLPAERNHLPLLGVRINKQFITSC